MNFGMDGGQEVRVQFLGFGSEDYQWVSIKNAVPQRSFPCETIKCVVVLPGETLFFASKSFS
jgi:hypothetical protein